MKLYFDVEGGFFAFNDIEAAILKARGLESAAPDRDRDGAAGDRKVLDLMREPKVQRVMLALGGLVRRAKLEG